ncbi:hypothetical protein ACFE04_002124 [Oxalis oulophora]
MGSYGSDFASRAFRGMVTFFISCFFRVLSVGPIPTHLAFVLDGNRRFAKKSELEVSAGYKAGYFAFVSLLLYSYKLGVKYVTIYAFSIDNFRRPPKEVKIIMDLMQEKAGGFLEKDSLVHRLGVRVFFIGNLKLLSDPVRITAEKVMKATANNTNFVLSICVAYTSTNEILRATERSCKAQQSASSDILYEYPATTSVNENLTSKAQIDVDSGVEEKQEMNQSEPTNGMIKGIFQSKNGEGQCPPSIKLVDIEKHMDMAIAPEPDVLIRTSGETRLSNFLLWQTSSCLLYSPHALWPEIGLRHFVELILSKMGKHGRDLVSRLFRGATMLVISCIFRILSVGPIHSHLAFVLDENRRFAKKKCARRRGWL